MCHQPLRLSRGHEIVGDILLEKEDVVPCGKCPECLKRKQQMWAFRLWHEMNSSFSAGFATFTYENAPISKNGLPTLDKRDFQKFIKRLRQDVSKQQVEKLRYYACGEYGTETQRPHYHAIMFNLPQAYTSVEFGLEKNWQKGMVQVVPANMATIYYTTKYMMKSDFKREGDQDDREKEFSLQSKGLGEEFITPEMYGYYKKLPKSYVTMPDGWKATMPRYFKEKIYTEEELEQLSRITQIEVAEKITNRQNKFNSQEHLEQWKKDQVRKMEKAQKRRNEL